jgi:hypothetical protein
MPLKVFATRVVRILGNPPLVTNLCRSEVEYHLLLSGSGKLIKRQRTAAQAAFVDERPQHIVVLKYRNENNKVLDIKRHCRRLRKKMHARQDMAGE